MSKAESDILITQPPSITLLTLLACAVTISIFLFLFIGEYTQKQRVVGVLVPDKGLMKIYTPEAGTVVSLQVHEGDLVGQGQLLYTLTSDRISAGKAQNSREIQKHLSTQGNSLAEEASRQKIMNDDTIAGTRHAYESLQSELKEMEQSQQLLEQQINIAKNSLARYEELAEKGISSKIQIEERRIDLLNRESRRLDLRREHTALVQKINAAKQELTTAILRGKNQLASIERSREVIAQNLLDGEPEREIRIMSPAAGTVTGIAAKPGQWSAGTTPLLRLLPAGATLQAELYAPSSAISFIKKGSRVLLRYKAFPYQKFGQQQGTVSYVSRVAVPVSELDSSTASLIGPAPVYRITVDIPKQFILAYGNREALQAGMELEADILLDSRRLYEWMLEPLFSITGKI